jgi:tRNA(Ile)-lysidine synthase
MAQLLAGDWLALEGILEKAWQNSLLESGPEYLAFDLSSLLAEPEATRRLVVRRGIETLRPGIRDAGYEVIDRALAALSGPPQPAQVDLIAGLRLSCEEGRVWLASREANLPATGWPRLPEGEVYPLNIPGEIRLPDGWVLQAESVDHIQQAQQEAESNSDPFSAWLSLDGLEPPLVVRARRLGERIAPLGLGGHSLKLSDLMVNAKIPRRARNTWPLVCCDGVIIWVPGLRLAHAHRLRPETRSATHLRLWQPLENQSERYPSFLP